MAITTVTAENAKKNITTMMITTSVMIKMLSVTIMD